MDWPPLLQVARDLVASGISVLPMPTDGSKRHHASLIPYAQNRSDLGPGDELLNRMPTDDELVGWFGKNDCGLAVVTGPVSGHLECIDIDESGLVQPFMERMKWAAPGIIERLVLVRTPRNGHGLHAYYRSPAALHSGWLIPGNFINGDRVGQRAETFARGGRMMHPASPAACHPTGRRYELVQGDFAHVQTLTPAERRAMHSCAVSFSVAWLEGGDFGRLDEPAHETRFSAKSVSIVNDTKQRRPWRRSRRVFRARFAVYFTWGMDRSGCLLPAGRSFGGKTV